MRSTDSQSTGLRIRLTPYILQPVVYHPRDQFVPLNVDGTLGEYYGQKGYARAPTLVSGGSCGGSVESVWIRLLRTGVPPPGSPGMFGEWDGHDDDKQDEDEPQVNLGVSNLPSPGPMLGDLDLDGEWPEDYYPW